MFHRSHLLPQGWFLFYTVRMEEKKERNNAIKFLAKNGWRYSELARIFNLTRQTVFNIVRRDKD